MKTPKTVEDDTPDKPPNKPPEKPVWETPEHWDELVHTTSNVLHGERDGETISATLKNFVAAIIADIKSAMKK